MVRNNEKYVQALQFRARGFTLEEIAKICDVSKSTVSKWLKNNDISKKITEQNKRRAGQENAKRLQLMVKARGRERTIRYKEVEQAASVEFKHYYEKPLFIAGIALYAAIGDLKNPQQIRISGTESIIHRLFISFATEFLGVAKTDIHIWLQLYQGQSEERCMKHWKTVARLPYTQFYKNHYVKTKMSKTTLHYGVGNTIIGSTVLKPKLIRWIELLHKELKT